MTVLPRIVLHWRRVALLAVATSGMLLAPLAIAGNVTGTVAVVYIRATDGLVYFNVSGTTVGRATCATNTTYWMVMNKNSTVGKQQLAARLAAQTSGRSVTVYGNGTCVRWPDGEDVAMLQIN